MTYKILLEMDAVHMFLLFPSKGYEKGNKT